LIILSNDNKITDQDVITNVTSSDRSLPLTELFDKFDKFQDFKEHIEKFFIEHKLKENNWNVSKTAEDIDIQRSHLYNKIEKYDLKRAVV